MNWLAQYLATPVTPLYDPRELVDNSPGAVGRRNSAMRREADMVARYHTALADGPLTTPEIGRALGLAKPSSTMYKLEALGMVERCGQLSGAMGRKTNLWKWIGEN